MTLTDILPSLRRTIAAPLARDLWPEHTCCSTTDVTVAAVSMSRLTEICGTPCVHSAAAVIPGTQGRPSETELASVVAMRVTFVTPVSEGMPRRIGVDAHLENCAAITAEIRLIGRASTARTTRFVLMPTGTEVELPADIAEGDILVVPCTGVATLRQVRWETPSVTSVPGVEPSLRCGR